VKECEMVGGKFVVARCDPAASSGSPVHVEQLFCTDFLHQRRYRIACA
jgi:hypothetical protein